MCISPYLVLLTRCLFLLQWQVNFHPEIITLSKEVRNLKHLGFRIPLTIMNKAHLANSLYPFAISLIESVRTYERTLEKVNCFFHLVFLLSILISNSYLSRRHTFEYPNKTAGSLLPCTTLSPPFKGTISARKVQFRAFFFLFFVLHFGCAISVKK